MKKTFYGFTLFFCLSSFAGIDPLILIRGSATGTFSEKEIQVKDSFGQVYNLPRSVFPKEFVPEAGKSFSVEVHEKILKDLKVQKPKAKNK